MRQFLSRGPLQVAQSEWHLAHLNLSTNWLTSHLPHNFVSNLMKNVLFEQLKQSVAVGPLHVAQDDSQF